MKLAIEFVAVVLLLASQASAGVLSYDSGVMGVSMNWGMYGAVRFTNPYLEHYMKVENVRVYGHPNISGTINVYVWDDNGGQPGNVLDSLTSQALGSSWTSYDFSDSNILIDPKGDVFAGFYEGLSAAWGDAPYDTNNTTTHRSWYKSGSSWVNGQPGSGDRDLMVRLEYSQGPWVPEPSSLVLISVGLIFCLCCRRRR